jgi:uracil phosphoribosyltransferase
MEKTVVEHPLAHEHSGRSAAEPEGTAFGHRATLRALAMLLVAEVTRGIEGTGDQANGSSTLLRLTHLVVPLSSEGLEMVVMTLPLFSNVDLGFVGSPTDLNLSSGLIWQRYLPGDVTNRATVLLDLALTQASVPVLAEAVRTLSSRGVASIRAGYTTASPEALAEIASTDLPFKLVALTSS